MTKKPSTTDPDPPSPARDPAVEELEKQTARVLARQDLADARLGALGSLAPAVKDGPTNTVTFGAKAGSLAPWLAHTVLADVADKMSAAVWESLGTRQGDDKTSRWVVFVTDDPELLASDLVSRQVQETMRGRRAEIGSLAVDLAGAVGALRDAVRRYQQEEATRAAQQAQPPAPPAGHLLRSALATAESAAAAAATEAESASSEASEEETEPETSAAGTSPLAVAVDLVRLLAVDFAVTAADVTVDSALLARLTSGRMASTPGHGQDVVLLDGLAPADNSATFAAYSSLVTALNAVAVAARTLRSVKAPVDAEAEEYRLAVAEAREAWEEAVAAETPVEGAADAFKEAADELSRRVQARVAAAAAADDLLAVCAALTQTVREELRALTTSDPQGVSPLQRACSRDRLQDRTDDDTRIVTHVLLVEATHTGADIVTRRSVLGASGRVGYLGGANGAWVLIDVTGNVRGGGSVDSASHMTHDITTGESRRSLIRPRANAWTSKDPLEKNERWLRTGVLLLALAIALFSVAATLAVILPD